MIKPPNTQPWHAQIIIMLFILFAEFHYPLYLILFLISSSYIAPRKITLVYRMKQLETNDVQSYDVMIVKAEDVKHLLHMLTSRNQGI